MGRVPDQSEAQKLGRFVSSRKFRAQFDVTRTVWLHGAGLSADTWSGRAEGLCLDLPGHRAFPRVQRPEVSEYVKIIEPRLPKRFNLVGHDLGGMIAMEIAARWPERVSALVLAETAYVSGDSRMLIGASPLGVWTARRLGAKRFAWYLAHGESSATRAAIRQQIGAMDLDALCDALRAIRDFDGTDLLPKLEMPVLILVGRDHTRSHSQARDMVRAIPNARLMTMRGGHMLHSDAPEKFYSTIKAFLKPYS